MHTSSPGIQSKITSLAFALMLLTLWLLVSGYHGLTGDAQLYAFQALARIHPALSTDLYLQNTSQDQFTVFSPLYAWFIGLLGLEDAARTLTVFFILWLLAAAWSLARAIAGRDTAWLCVGFLLIVVGDYGGSGVFRISEQFLTARLPAEALIITALVCQTHGWRRTGLLLAVAALLVHPLIALPGLLLLICLQLPIRVGILAAMVGVVLTLAVALAASQLSPLQHMLSLMDEPWLEIVRERSQFLFLHLWSAQDWQVNIRPFFYLAFTVIALSDDRIRRLCLAAALVGAAGLAVALIGGLIGPLAILVQGQAWRWVWPAVLLSALLLPVTALQAWQHQKCGPLCAMLLVAGYTVPAVDGIACVSIALLLWLAREQFNDRTARYVRWISTALGIAIVAWILVRVSTILYHTVHPSERVALTATQLRDVFGLKISAVLLGALAWWWLRTCRTIWWPALLSAMLIMLSIYVLPAAFKQSRTFAAAAEIREFADWANAIPATSTVLLAPARDVGGFAWFTLGRPNYLAVNQSAGVVFSRATAVEVKRRSEVLLPLMLPNWKVMSSLRSISNRGNAETATRPLTAENLFQVCSDASLGFVISPVDLGFAHLRHNHAGAWKDWNLYDCRKIRPILFVPRHAV